MTFQLQITPIHLFADDVKLLKVLDSRNSVLSLQYDLFSIDCWSSDWKVILIALKCSTYTLNCRANDKLGVKLSLN